MREHKFRGMDANGIMRYGRLSQDRPNETIYYQKYSQRICWDNSNIPISNDTMGEFIGVLDRNGKDIYEGDVWIYKCVVLENGKDKFKTAVALVKWEGIGFNLEPLSDCWFYNNITEGEIVGNIYENPELLQKDAQASVANV